MGSQERRARHKQELRVQIMNAARELFVAEGFEKVTMRRIAEKIEYSPKTLYLYFNDKTEILYHLCEEVFARLREKVQGLGTDFANAEEFVRAGLRAYIEFGLENPNDYKIAFLTDIRHYPYRSHEELPPDSTVLAAQRTLEEALKACIEQKLFRPVDVHLASHVLWAGIHGLTCVLILDPEFRRVHKDKLVDMTIDTLIRGFQCDKSH